MSLLCRLGLHKWRYLKALTIRANCHVQKCARCERKRMVEPFL